jgi:hypothetical protein
VIDAIVCRQSMASRNLCGMSFSLTGTMDRIIEGLREAGLPDSTTAVKTRQTISKREATENACANFNSATHFRSDGFIPATVAMPSPTSDKWAQGKDYGKSTRRDVGQPVPAL